MYARDSKHAEVFMEDLDVSECCDDTILPDFGGIMSTTLVSGTKRKLRFPEETVKDDGFNDRLRRAARKSQSEGSLTPVVKEELRCFIAAKRHQEGKQDIKIEFKEPELHPLTPDEICKKERRREQNRRAATKCRRKKRDAKICKESEMSVLRESNSTLQKQVKILNCELKQLAEILNTHETSGQCCLSTNTSFMANIPLHHYDGSYREEPETSELLYSPRSPSSFFSSSMSCSTTTEDCSGFMQHFPGDAGMSTEIIGQALPNLALNGTTDLTPPVSPYLTEFPENILDNDVDPQLSVVLRNVDLFAHF